VPTSLEAFEASMSGRVPTTTFGPQAALAELDLWGVNSDPNGVVVTDSTALTLMPFLAGVTLIAEAMAVMPINVWRKRKSGGRDKADQHPAQYCLQKTNNGWMTPSVFKSFSQGCLLMSGNSIGEIIRNGRGQAVEIHHWLPRNTQYGVDSNGSPMYGIMGSAYQSPTLPIVEFKRDFNALPKPEWFPYSECIHLKGFSTDGFIGRSPLASARNAVALSLTIEQFGLRNYTKGRPVGFITKPEKMTKDQRDLLREEWREMYEGVQNALKIGVLSGGIDWKTMGFTNDDAQFLQTRQYQVLEIARMLRIPPHMLGDLSQATETNIEQLFLEFITVTLQPWMVRWQEELNLKLFTPMEQFTYEVEFDIEAFLRGDKLTQAKVDEAHLRNGQRTIDETRIRDGLNAYDDEIGSKPLVMASQLDTLENVIDGTSLLHSTGSTPSTAKKVAQ
jgi:HK97 family phage portal protein